jgi:hypothetical protein
MITKNETIVDLAIINFKEPPSEIADILDIQPSRMWLKDELVYPKTLIRRKENGLEISSSLSKYHSFREHISCLIDILTPLKDKFKNLPATCEIKLSCHIYIYEEGMPDISLEANEVKVLSDVNARIDIDTYCLASDETGYP